MRYSDHKQRQLDIQSGAELDRAARRRPKYAVRHAINAPRYEVYSIDTDAIVNTFGYRTEAQRADAMRQASATRNDLNVS